MTIDNDSPQRVDGLEGTVVRGPFGVGSKSEREAVWLKTFMGRFVLRRKNGPTFKAGRLRSTWASE